MSIFQHQFFNAFLTPIKNCVVYIHNTLLLSHSTRGPQLHNICLTSNLVVMSHESNAFSMSGPYAFGCMIAHVWTHVYTGSMMTHFPAGKVKNSNVDSTSKQCQSIFNAFLMPNKNCWNVDVKRQSFNVDSTLKFWRQNILTFYNAFSTSKFQCRKCPLGCDVQNKCCFQGM